MTKLAFSTRGTYLDIGVRNPKQPVQHTTEDGEWTLCGRIIKDFWHVDDEGWPGAPACANCVAKLGSVR